MYFNIIGLWKCKRVGNELWVIEVDIVGDDEVFFGVKRLEWVENVIDVFLFFFLVFVFLK